MGCNGKCLCLSDVSRVGIRELASPKLEVRLSTSYLSNLLLSKGGCFTKKYVTHMATEMNIQVILYMG